MKTKGKPQERQHKASKQENPRRNPSTGGLRVRSGLRAGWWPNSVGGTALVWNGGW